MTNKEWLDYLAHNAPDELAAWFDAEHVETEERALDGIAAALEAEYGKGGVVGGSFCDTPEQGEVVIPLESWREYLGTEPENEDSREQLEAEIAEWAAVMNLEGYQLDMIHGWLNRRAKIMERKMVEMNQRYFDCVEQEKKIAELQAKVDELTQVAESKRLSFADRIRFVNEIDELTAERDKLQELNEYHALQYELASEDADRLQVQVDKLTAERDELKWQVFTLKYLYNVKAEREHYREKFGKCIDYADAIHALMDDEGMA